MSDLQDKSKQELLEEAREQNVEGRSSMNKDELVEALSNPSDQSPVSEGAEERLDQVEEKAPESADLVDKDLDFHGPLLIQPPEERIMTGAVSEEQAKEQEKLTANKPKDYIGEVTEAGFDKQGNLLTRRGPVKVSKEQDSPEKSDEA